MNDGWGGGDLGWEEFRESLSVTDDIEGKLGNEDSVIKGLLKLA